MRDARDERPHTEDRSALRNSGNRSAALRDSGLQAATRTVERPEGGRQAGRAESAAISACTTVRHAQRSN